VNTNKTLAAVGLGSLAALAVLLIAKKSKAAAPTSLGDNPPVQSPPFGTGTGILATVGKNWILTNKTAQSGKAANYSWHFVGSSFGGQSFEASVSLPGVRVIQGIGTAHDRFHADYSQTCVLAAEACIYQGQDARLSDILQDPVASKLVSVEGPMINIRQPGVPQLDPLSAPPVGSVSRADVTALPNDVTKREPILLSWVEQGLAEYQWADVTVGDMTFHVFADALQFGGVRVSMSATLEQQIADRLSCRLLTARMADLVFASATKIITPFPLPYGPQMSSTAYMLTESDKIAQAAGL